MKSILFVAHDPGGANVIKPVIEHYAKHDHIQSHCLLLGPAAERITPQSPTLQRHHVRTIATPDFPNELSAEPEDIAALLDALKPDVVFTATSFNSNLERLAVRFANERGIPTVSILDFWSNYAKRFTLDGMVSAPEVLFVADGRMKREAEAELPATTVVISGNPHLALITAKYAETRQKEASQIQAPLSRIRFFCENIRHYYPDKAVNEFSIMPTFLQSLTESGFHGEVFIRPHPMESREPWAEEITKYELGITNARKRFAAKPAIIVRLDTATFDEVLCDRYAAVGFTSMVLLETASVGIPTFSYQIDVPDDYFWLPFEEYGIMRLRREEDIAHLVMSSPSGFVNTTAPTTPNVIAIIDKTLHQLLVNTSSTYTT
jgi:hypothetical protein